MPPTDREALTDAELAGALDAIRESLGDTRREVNPGLQGLRSAETVLEVAARRLRSPSDRGGDERPEPMQGDDLNYLHDLAEQASDNPQVRMSVASAVERIRARLRAASTDAPSEEQGTCYHCGARRDEPCADTAPERCRTPDRAPTRERCSTCNGVGYLADPDGRHLKNCPDCDDADRAPTEEAPKREARSRWTKDDQKILAGLSNRAADAKEEDQDTMLVVPEDIEWAVEWLCDLIHGE